MLRLNGGLGTSMGLSGAKSLLEAKDGNSFLDIIARQVLALRERFDARLPLVLMNSFSTRDDSLKALEAHPELDVGLPLDFLQNKEPKLLVEDLTPVRVAGRSGARMVPAGPRRPLHRARHERHARTAARAGLRVRVRGQLGQPRRGAGPAHPRVAARREHPVRDGGHRPHGGRPQGRPPRRPALGRPAGPARDGADAGRGPRGAGGHHPPPLREHEQPLGLAARARRGAARRLPRAADDPQREDGRSLRQVLPRRLPTRDGDGRGDRGLRRRSRPARPAHALRARQDHRRPAGAALGRLRADRRRAHGARRRPHRTPRSSRSTQSTTSCCATSRSASRPARRRWWSATASRSRATCTSAPVSSRAATCSCTGPRRSRTGPSSRRAGRSPRREQAPARRSGRPRPTTQRR